MSLQPSDGTLLLALYAAIYFQKSKLNNKEIEAYYKQRSGRLSCSFPQWVFRVIWDWVLLPLKLFSGFFFLYSGAPSINYFTAVFLVYFFEIVVNKEWTVLFFDQETPYLALGIAFLLFILNVLYGIFVGLWVGFGVSFFTIIPYVVWHGVAILWNVQWISGGGKEKQEFTTNVVDLQKSAPSKPALKTPNMKLPGMKNLF